MILLTHLTGRRSINRNLASRRKCHVWFVLGLAWALAACGFDTLSVAEAASSTSLTEAATALSPASMATVGVQGGLSLSAAKNDLFTTAGMCNACHMNLTTSDGTEVSPAEFWRASIMANSARDPYYLASVRLELVESPDFAAEIENKCSICHMPMAHFNDAARGNKSLIFGEGGYLDPGHPLNAMAGDGVSCTVCHQIPASVGSKFRHSGSLAIDLTAPMGERIIYGPFSITERGKALMKGGSGYVTLQSEHISQSALCANCHELHINYITEEGTLSQGGDVFPEQKPYSEWLASRYSTEGVSCQDCHMPKIQKEAPLSNVMPDQKYEPISLHVFAGGNVFMLNLLKVFGDEVGVEAESKHFEALISRTVEKLTKETAALTVSEPTQDGDEFIFDVITEVRTGHKFPTSFPSRRAWLHVTVTDATTGQVIFESGEFEPKGRIADNDNDSEPQAYEPHYDVITTADQVQVYESVMKTKTGQVTTLQMRASGFIKDNRLLPEGFDKTAVSDLIAVTGQAATDDDFVGGQDKVTYRIPVEGGQGPFTVAVELLYQSIGHRWAQNLMSKDTEEARTFGRYYNALGNEPVVVASQRMKGP